MYSHPLYIVCATTPEVKIAIKGWFSDVTDNNRHLTVTRKTKVFVPLPAGARPAKGTDSQLLIWNPETGDEWGFWQARQGSDGKWTARNGYHYNTRWNGVPPTGFVSRGSGGPYLAGLIRPWELKQKQINHAIGLSINYPSRFWVFPATKSDGAAMPPALPEGARLQLYPGLTEADFDRWKLSPSGKTIARALQKYGMILTDGSGHPKLSVEYEGTAQWGKLLNKKDVKNIPYTAFRVLSLDAPDRPDPPEKLSGKLENGIVTLTWSASVWATRYRVLAKITGVEDPVVLNPWTTTLTYRHSPEDLNKIAGYQVVAVSHNGISTPAHLDIPKGLSNASLP